MFVKLYKILAIFGIILIIVLTATVWLKSGLAFAGEKTLEVDFLDIGQGDSILIKTPLGQNILIDGGPDNSVIRRLGENLPFWNRVIDLMVLTHPHDDHISGLIEVLKRYQVKKILYTGVSHTSPSYLSWLEVIKEKRVPLVIIDRPQTISFGHDCRLKILFPRENLAGRAVENLNNTSIIARLVYRQAKFLFTGDAEKEEENELLAAGTNLDADVLKVCHHGSNTSSQMKFLIAVRPRVAVIQADADNRFGFPSRRVLNRFKKIGARIYLTGRDGTVKIITDGQHFKTVTR